MWKKVQNGAATAHHEAGHAVVAFYLDMRFKYVTVIPEEGSFGHVLHEPNTGNFDDYPEYSVEALEQRSLWERHVIISFAGRIAQEKYLGRRVRYGYRSDYEGIALYALQFGDKATHVHWCRWLHALAQNMVRSRWPEIEAVAQALIERKCLTFDDVRQTIDQHYRIKPLVRSLTP